jgi:D-serine deaminase-like pyridoxal phosphate-dependent protein
MPVRKACSFGICLAFSHPVNLETFPSATTISSVAKDWFVVADADEIESPALLLYPERIAENIRRMVKIAGDPNRLRPHAKTHKLGPIASLQIAAGIQKFKVATIAEAETLARAGAGDVLLAYQPVGPNVRRLIELIRAFPRTQFACLLDDLGAARELSHRAASAGVEAGFFLDLDCGQHRTGVPLNDGAVELYQALCRLPGLQPRGLHAYDGHIHTPDPEVRRQECDAAFAPVAALCERMRAANLTVPTLITSGTPTFPIHARRSDVECSPGTCVLWDYAYSSQLRDLDFLHAALVLTRVVSKPAPGRLCLDLGHKAIASENPQPRVHFLNATDARLVAHSEEHLVVEIESSADWQVGDVWYGVPWHVCPTVALHAEAVVIEHGRATERWRIAARERHLEF